MTYSEICDSVMTKLKAKKVDIGVLEDAIIEGGREGIPPSINVFVDPDVDLDENKGVTNPPSFLGCRIDLVCLVASETGDDTARRKAELLCAKAVIAVMELPMISELANIAFAQTNSDATACVATLTTKMEFV